MTLFNHSSIPAVRSGDHSHPLAHSTILILAALLLAWPACVRACDFCLIHQGISPLETQNGKGLRINQRYTLLDSVYAGTDEIPNPGAQEEFWTTDFSGFYSLRKDFMLLANLPIRITRLDGHLHVHHDGEVHAHGDTGGDEGIGDISLLGRYTFLTLHNQDTTTLLAITGGVKLPAGSTDGRNDEGEYLDAHTQLGTGSVDGLIGLSFNHARDRVSVSGNILYSINTGGETGDVDHEFGDSINYDVTAKYRVAPSESGQSRISWFASLGIAGEARGKEEEDGSTVPDSGGHTIYFAPGLQLIADSHWVAEFTWRQAVYHDLNATQLGEDFKAFVSLTFLF
jgi:hypothetical protein